ncbi:flavodoxin [Bifidobacterium psychraerophilum]|uniref:flavodoxin n=1 Tax=Bifidobacterium psychraerophilum TaxID=218140 RepID=UPI0039E8FF49
MKNRRFLIFPSIAIIIIAAAVAYFVLVGRPGGESGQPARSNQGKTLVVVFSRSTGVYDGPSEVGHTMRVANYIQQATNADLYEIIPSQDYPDDYQETTEVAREEQDTDARPQIRDPLPEVGEYESVFVGAPIWWSEYPMVVRTFLDGVDLNGKTVIPFTTHEGSGPGNTKEQLERQYPDADVLDGLAIRGGQADDSQDDVVQWLRQIGH